MNRTQLLIECNQHWTPWSNAIVINLYLCCCRMCASNTGLLYILDWMRCKTMELCLEHYWWFQCESTWREHVMCTWALLFITSKSIFVNLLINIQELCTTFWFQVHCRSHEYRTFLCRSYCSTSLTLLSQEVRNHHMTFVHTNARHCGCFPIVTCTETKNFWIPKGSLYCSNVIVLIVDHSHILLVWGS